MTIPDMKIKEREYSNKSRQGTYVEVKGKGLPARAFKKDPRLPIELYLTYYEERYVKKRNATNFTTWTREYLTEESKKGIGIRKTEAREQISKIVRKLKNKPEMGALFKTGSTSTTITNADKASTEQIKRAYRELHEPLIEHKELLPYVLGEHNAQKMRSRYEITIRSKDASGTVTARGTMFGKTIEEAIRALKKETAGMSEADKDYEIVRVMRNVGMGGVHNRDTHLGPVTWEMEVTFRRGQGTGGRLRT